MVRKRIAHGGAVVPLHSGQAAPRVRRLLAGIFLSALAGPAWGAACGDAIEGGRVPCACGDRVVTDTVLWATDPVVAEPCRGDGLVIDAPTGSDGLTLNLGGQSLLGNGRGAGIRVVDGGRLGSVIVGGDEDEGRGEIARFELGIRASGSSALREVRGLDIHDNTGDGLSLKASGALVADVATSRNGGDGLVVNGHGNEVSALVSEHNKGNGLVVRGSATTVAGQSVANGGHGAAVSGRGNTVRSLVTAANAGASVAATGSSHDVAGVQSAGDAGGQAAGKGRESR